MPTTLPVPLQFRLPDGWLAARQDDPGATSVAFAAVHPRPDAGFAATITIDGHMPAEEATPADCADAAVGRLREAAESVAVVHRREIGSADAPGLTQRVAFSTIVDGVRRDLVQSQVYLFLPDVTDPRRRAVIQLVLTATEAQHDDVLPDFQVFVGSVRPDTGTEV
ncbi:hypothetical protein ACFY93_02085 [Streptomyces sp. NPDC008313]|uniref:hypothetical protein n=1 Tax=Streptomyces sp. NPDC008313 TaxID=3364826 RepID=UPI0036E99DD9